MSTQPPQAPSPGPQARRTCIVAIDGPAASGKSSTAQWVAEKLGFRHVDSGALYRAATLAALREAEGDASAGDWTEDEVLRVAADVSLRPAATTFTPYLGELSVDQEVRGTEVTRHVSWVAQMPRVRDWVNEMVRRTAMDSDVVVDGRDIGTAVFPEADLKVFLVADPWERARRRLLQRLGRGPSDEEIAEETDRLVQRDAKDATQTVQAKDAVLIDTTYLTQEEQVERIVALARAVTHRGDGTSGVGPA
ncbi:MAG TPA: (d)CMP kinase [Gemmatimonadaceae bacterium]